jgi:hypothetical protein
MSEYIYVRIGNKIWDDMIQEKFKGFILVGYNKDQMIEHKVSIDRFLQILNKEANEAWAKVIEENQ